jgi:hypothetical protein
MPTWHSCAWKALYHVGTFNKNHGKLFETWNLLDILEVLIIDSAYMDSTSWAVLMHDDIDELP